MRYFFTLLRLRIKAGAASRTFLLTAVCFLALSAVLSAALPDSSRMSLEVGLVAEGERAERVTARLMQNEDYRFIRYPGQEEIGRAGGSGREAALRISAGCGGTADHRAFDQKRLYAPADR